MSSLGNTSALYEKLKYYNNIGLETGYLKQHFTLGTMPRDLRETSAPARQKKPVSTGASGCTFDNEIISCPRAIVIHQDCSWQHFLYLKCKLQTIIRCTWQKDTLKIMSTGLVSWGAVQISFRGTAKDYHALYYSKYNNQEGYVAIVVTISNLEKKSTATQNTNSVEAVHHATVIVKTGMFR